MKLAVSFTNFGPYHLARLRALSAALAERGDSLIAYETAGRERRYPWGRSETPEPFEWTVLFPDRDLESLGRTACRRAMFEALERDNPDALGIVGYVRPESLAMLRWARAHSRPTVLMSESQEIDHPRVWWKEAVKARRVARFSAGLVGGPRHADYLIRLGLPPGRIALGYNAVDNDAFARWAADARLDPNGRAGLPDGPYFIAVSRFVPEKNLVGLIRAFAHYRQRAGARPWSLVLCGGGPDEAVIEAAARESGVGDNVHRPGFLQAEGLARWLSHATAFVHPSLMEPWGLVANEAAACGLPLLISDRAGCAETLVPDPPGTTGRRFDPTSIGDLSDALLWMSSLPESERLAMGERAAAVVAEWGPARFARGTLEALELASAREQQNRRESSPLSHRERVRVRVPRP
jgi:1,2-diacylglycerol 3-alpha-glucosyltransferase